MSNTHWKGAVTGLLGRAAFVTILVGCGSSTEPEPSTDGSLRAEVTDPSGDAVQPPFGPLSPDLVRVEAEATRDSVTFRIRFAANTYDSLTTSTFIQLDTDQNSATGVFSPGLGMDYIVIAQRTQSFGTHAGVMRCPSPAGLCPELTVAVPVRYVANGLDLTIEMPFLGGDDGRMSFVVFVSGLAGTVTDYAPDISQSPAATR